MLPGDMAACMGERPQQVHIITFIVIAVVAYSMAYHMAYHMACHMACIMSRTELPCIWSPYIMHCIVYTIIVKEVLLYMSDVLYHVHTIIIYQTVMY